jgi:hypothetical protein
VRDDFLKPVVETLAKRVGNRCSNSGCRKRTSGPHTDDDKALNVGVAAHITAASPGGPRYDPSLTPDERKSIENGIWLCQSCAKLVDNDEARYTKNILVRWKQDAEKEALREIEATAKATDLHFENTEVSGGNGSVGPGGDARIKGAKSGGGVTFIGGSIRGGDGGEGGGKGGDATIEGGDG